MFGKLEALYAPEYGDAAGGAGGGASSEGEGKGKKPEDGEETVPVKQLRAALSNQERKHQEEMAAVRAEIEALKTAKPADPPKRYTRAELRAAVEAQQITQDQADEQMDLQIREEAKAEARREAHSTVAAEQRKERVGTEMSRYKTVAPEILEDGDTRAKIMEEYQYFRNLGDPKTIETELKAIRMVLGPVDRLERARSGRASHESHRETGDGAGHSERPAKKFADTLSPELRERYSGLIQKGIYKDWAEVEAERKFARPPVRRRQA